MRKTSFSTLCVLALAVSGCRNSDDDNRTLEFDTLQVNFESSLTAGSWTAGAEVGIFATCTREERQHTSMSARPHARYATRAADESSLLRCVTDEDAIVARAADHNFRFCAYYPYSDAETDPTSIAAAAPARQPYPAEAGSAGLYTASKSVTTVVPTVPLEFRNVFATLELHLPGDLLDEEGGSVIKSLRIEPAEAVKFDGALAVSGTYDLLAGTFSEDPATRAQQIEVDFGAKGLRLGPDYTSVPLTVAPFTVPEGGFKLTFKDLDDHESTLTILSNAEQTGIEVPAGEVLSQYLSTSSDGIVPVNFPVVFPLGVTDGVKAFTPDTQPLWKEQGIWTCPSQPQAVAQWHKVSDPSEQYGQEFRITNNGQISSPEIRGIWTGDYLEFTLPVRNFAAGTSLSIAFPMYTRQGPVFWNIEYLDGEEWKCRKQLVTSYDPAHSLECTYSLVRGGKVIEHTMTFENPIKSGHLRVRLTCADGSVQAAAATTVEVRDTPWVNNGAYAAPFYFYMAGSDQKSIKFSIN